MQGAVPHSKTEQKAQLEGSAAVLPAAAKMHPPRRSERRLFSTSDDNAMMKQITATHSPDSREVEVKPVLVIIEDVLRRATVTPSIEGVVNGTLHEKTEAFDEKAAFPAFDGLLDSLAYIIHKLSCELSCKCSGSGDAHGSTMAILNMLSSYSWEAKVVLSLAAFAVIYGEFWLVAQLYATNPLAKSVSMLKQLPDIVEHSHLLKPRFEAINNLIKALLDVTKCIVSFTELPSQYIASDTAPMSLALAHIPTAVYWTIRSMVACVSQIISLLGMSYEHITATTEAWELSSLAHKIHNIDEHLKTQLLHCHQHIDDKRHDEYFQMLVRLFEVPHLDNLKILKHVIYLKDDQLPLVVGEGSAKTRVTVEALRKKTVLLVVSDLDLSMEELYILNLVYQESRSRKEMQFEMVWLTVVDRSRPWSEEHKQKFEYLQNQIPWHTLHHPSLLEPAVIRYIKEEWHFSKKLIVVVLDPQGKVVCQNAQHMLWIWGAMAYPFTSVKEEALWREETWRLEFLVNGIEQLLLEWIGQEKFICVYGGEDMEWIRKFTTTAKKVASTAGITLELIYVGKNNAKERVHRNNITIATENLSHYLQNPFLIWYFWSRLESMLFSKMQYRKKDDPNDTVKTEVMTMLGFDGNDKGWAVISRGTAEMARAQADTFLSCLEQYPAWEQDARQIGFVQAIIVYLQQNRPPHHCNRLILPGISGGIPELVVCAECSRPMEKFFMYRCCTD